MQVVGAFSQAQHLPREPRATTIQVADGSPAVPHLDLPLPSTIGHERYYSETAARELL